MANRQGGFISGSPTTISQKANFAAGNQSADDLKAFAQSAVIPGAASGMWNMDEYYNNVKDSNWPSTQPSDVAPTAGGTLTINSLSLGSYDYVIKHGNQTVSTFTNSDWFTTTEDSRSALIYVDGNLTINSGQTFQPSNRKLFTCIYVNGDLTVNGTLSMTARGANTTADDGNVTAQNIKLIADGTYSSVTNPQIPAAGGAGGARATQNNGSYPGDPGAAGTAGGTGGGGQGGWRENNGGSAPSIGNGAAGTCFSGGAASGGCWTTGGGSGNSGEANGGAGGNGGTAQQSSGAFGGAGNAGGSAVGTGAGDQGDNDGTGGVLIIYCTGTFSGTGTVSCDGTQGGWRVGYTTSDGSRGTSAGGGSGGGSLNVFYGTDSFSGTFTANGGAGGNRTGECSSGTCSGGNGGAGGAGTARRLSITAS